jgi:hypothetical protein
MKYGQKNNFQKLYVIGIAILFSQLLNAQTGCKRFLFSKGTINVFKEPKSGSKIAYVLESGKKKEIYKVVGDYIQLTDSNFVRKDGLLEVQRICPQSVRTNLNIQVIENKYKRELEKSGNGLNLNQGESHYILLPKIDTINVSEIKN